MPELMPTIWKHIMELEVLGFEGDTQQLKFYIKHLLRTHGLRVVKAEQIMKGVYWLYFKNKEERDMAFDAKAVIGKAEAEGKVVNGTGGEVWNPEAIGETIGIRVTDTSIYKSKKSGNEAKFISGTNLDNGEEIGFTLGVILDKIFTRFELEGKLHGRCFVIRYDGMEGNMKKFTAAEIEDPEPTDKAPF